MCALKRFLLRNSVLVLRTYTLLNTKEKQNQEGKWKKSIALSVLNIKENIIYTE